MKFFTYIFLLILPFSVTAQSDWDNIFTQKLSNGLLCIAVENPATPLNTVELVVKDGSVYEPKEENGIAYLNRYFFFAANKDFPGTDELTQRLKQLGAVTGNTVDEEYSSFYITLTKRNLDEGLKLMNSAARFPLYLEEDLQLAQKKALADFQSNQSNPDYLLLQAVNRKMLGKDASRKNIAGNFNVISSISLDKLLNHHKLFYTPSNCAIIVSGDIRHEEVFQKLQNVFGSWEKSTEFPVDKFPPPTVTVPYSLQTVVESTATSSPGFIYSWIAPSIRNALQMTYTAKVWAAMLSSATSPFNSALTGSGLIQQMSVEYKPEKFLSTLNINIIPNVSKMKQCYDKINIELAKTKLYSYYSEDLLRDAQKQLIGNFAYQTEKNTSLSHFLASVVASTDISYFTNYEENINAVTLDDIINFTNLFISDKSVTTGLIISPQQKQSLQTGLFFTDTFSPEQYNIRFTRNSGEIIRIENKNRITSLVQFVTLNPDLHMELIASQDAVEKKETAKERFLSVYKLLEAGGLSAAALDDMKVSIYIRHGNSDSEISNNMTVFFKAVK